VLDNLLSIHAGGSIYMLKIDLQESIAADGALGVAGAVTKHLSVSPL
jgi:hypothetical protein